MRYILNSLTYKFWSSVHQLAFMHVQRYQLQELTDTSFLDRFELEYDEDAPS